MPHASSRPMLDLNDFFYFVQVVERRASWLHRRRPSSRHAEVDAKLPYEEA
jgi:hypothetical protein